MGFGFPKAERDGLIESDPETFFLPPTSDLRYQWVCAHLDRLDDDEMRELVTDAWRMCTPAMLHDLPELPEPTAAAWAAMDVGEWGELRPLLHPYLHFDDGRTVGPRTGQGPAAPPGLTDAEAAPERGDPGRPGLPLGPLTGPRRLGLHRIAAMTQQPFSRPGAIDLSALKRPAQRRPPGGPAGERRRPGASYWLEVDEQSFQATLEASMTAPVLLVFYSPSRLPESEQMARDLATVAEEYEGRFLAGLVDIDAAPAIAQAVQLPSVPYVFAVLDGRPGTADPGRPDARRPARARSTRSCSS